MACRVVGFSIARRLYLRHLFLTAVVLVGALFSAPAQAQDSTPSSDQSPAPDSSAAKIAAKHWLTGPSQLRLADMASLPIPAGYAALTSPDANDFIALEGNPRPDGQIYILKPLADSKSWFTVLDYNDVGHVKDDESIDADALLANERTNSEAEDKVRAEKGLPLLPLQGWELRPEFNTYTKRLEWAYRFGSGNDITDNLNTRFLTRTGYFRAIVVTSPQSFASDIQDFNTVMGGLSLDTGSRYSAYQSGDKLAKYGLMGLIGGGAAAVAVKTGLFAALLAGIAKVAGALGIKAAFVAIVGAVAAVLTRVKKAIFGSSKKTGDGQ